MKTFALLLVCAVMAGCATVRQQDLDSWVGVPVEALDTHSFFLTVPMVKTISQRGIEVRNYANGADVSRCFTSGGANRSNQYVSGSAFATCSSDRVVCNNIFYIKAGVVLEYAPTGRCMTDERVQPERRYLRLTK